MFRKADSSAQRFRASTDFAAVAKAIGQRLSRSAIWHEDRCGWTGDDYTLIDREWKVIHQTVDPYLYSGNAGIALFLSWCGQYFVNEEMQRTALAAIRHSLYRCRLPRVAKAPLGLYDGEVGIALAACSLGRQLHDDGLLHSSRQLVDAICNRITTHGHGEAMDVVSGVAGMLSGLVQVARFTDDPTLHPVCTQLADLLVSRGRETPYGIYWPEQGKEGGADGLCGMAHGASGIAYALLEAWQLLSRNEYAAAAAQGMRYERTWFDRTASNWPDNRGPEGELETGLVHELSFPVYWCHGAAGIGLARLHAYRLTREAVMLAEATAAIHAAGRVVRSFLPRDGQVPHLPREVNMSVCHGLGSIVELFLYASQVLHSGELLRRGRDVGFFAAQVASREQGRWRCGILEGGETPGLMMGLAGIGSVFLQLAEPGRFPLPGLLNLVPLRSPMRLQ